MQASSSAEKQIASTPTGQSRTPRLWLLALLMLTALVAGGVLFVKYQLEVLRATVQAEIERRTGVFLEARSIRVDGLRGLRMEELHLAVDTESGPTIDAYVPDALLLVGIADLFQGRLSLNRIQLDDARILLKRPPGNFWLTEDVTERSALSNPIPFRAVGRNCTIEVEHIVGDSTLRIENLNFDLNRLADSPHIIANVDGRLNANSESGFQVFARYSSLENFDLRVEGDELSVDDLLPFVPELSEHVSAGVGQPSIRVSGYPRHTMVVGLELPFSALELQERPDYPLPTSGLLTALASYDMNTHLLTLSSARTISPEFEGEVEGTVSFARNTPEIDLRLEVEQFDLQNMLKMATGTWLKDRGVISLEATDPYRFFVTLKGSPPFAEIGVEAQLGSGQLRFDPAQPSYPEADLQFNLMSLSWRSDSGLPTGRLSLNGGTLTHPGSGVTASGISGTMTLGEGMVSFAPLVAEVAGNNVRGRIDYALESETLTLDLTGDLTAVEDIPNIRDHKKLVMRGPVAIESLRGELSPGKYTVDASIDLTRTAIDWEWWFSKTPGVGARVQDLRVEAVRGKTLALTGTAAVDTALIDFEMNATDKGGEWSLQSLDGTAKQVEGRTLDKVLNIPYAISSGSPSEGHLRWRRVSNEPDHVDLELGGALNEVSLLPYGTDTPIQGSDISIETRMVKIGEDRTGLLDVAVGSANLPPFGTPWFLPLRAKDDPSMEEFPPLDRDWSYNLRADTLAYPPWKGSDFESTAYASPIVWGFEEFHATVNDGAVHGMYATQREQNIHELDAKWESAPASYLLEHLKLPSIFTGTMTGGIAYTLDSDDSGTLTGSGYFDVVDGQFSADYLFSQFERQIEEASITLPPSLKFSHFSADVELEGDVVRTKNMSLESDAVTISGDGQFVVDGDMDYRIRLALPPDTARGIPALKTYFNLDGLKHSQTDLQLAFRVTGPSFAPRMELDGMPSVGDTILSGAVEVTSDVMKVVDLPRQILLDLFKIGGGIVGAGGNKSPSE